MALQRFLIAPYQTGLSAEVEPWLLPKDSFTEVTNGFIYRGVLRSRQGFSQFAIGGQAAVSTCQSRIVQSSTVITSSPITTDGAGAASFTLTNVPIRENDLALTIGALSVTDDGAGILISASTNITGQPVSTDGAGAASITLTDIPVQVSSVTFTIGAESITDDGAGTLTGTISATGSITYATGVVTITGATALTVITVAYSETHGTIDYVTGVASLTGAPTTTDVTATYNYYPSDSVTGLDEYITAINTNNELIVWDENRANTYNTATNRFDLISGGTFTGTTTDFVSSDNFISLSHALAATTPIAVGADLRTHTGTTQENPCVVYSANHGLVTGDEVVIASVGGMTELNIKQIYEVQIDSATGELHGNTDSSSAATFTLNNVPRHQDVTITIGAETIIDDGDGNLITDPGSLARGTVDYETGGITITGATASTAITATYNTNSLALVNIDARRFTAYTSGGTVARVTANVPDRRVLVFTNNVDAVQVYDGSSITPLSDEDGYKEPNADRGGAITTALHVLSFNGRMLLLRTTQASTVYPQRVLYSGTGPNRNDFTATEAGFIDAPTGDWLQSWAIYKGELIIFFEQSTFVLKTTGVATRPFRFVQIDESRSIKAPFGSISYLNKVVAIGPLGIIGTDVYNVFRIDTKIPNFTTNDVFQKRFNQVFAGRWDFNRQHIFLYPDKDTDYSTAALAANYEENTFSRYTLRMTVLDIFKENFSVTWADLINSWSSYSQSWSSFLSEKDAFFMASGDDKGFIYRFSDSDYDDSNFRITGITKASPGVISTTGNTFEDGDIVKISSVVGMKEINNAHYIVDSATSTSIQILNLDNTLIDTSGDDFTAYTSGGIVQKAIDFSATTKLLNPFIEQERRARLAYVDMYLSTRGPAVVSVSAKSTGIDNSGSEVTFTTNNIPVISGSVTVTDGTETFTDNGDGTLTGGAGGTGAVNYNDGTVTVTFNAASATAINVSYDYAFASVFVEFFIDDTTNAYKRVAIYPNDSLGLQKKFVRVAVNQTANFHRIKISQNIADEKLEIHGMVFAMEPAGPLARVI